MGNYAFQPAETYQTGQVVNIIHSKFTKDNEMPTNLFYFGSKAKVIKSKTMMQSRKTGKPISITEVVLPNKTCDTYVSENLRR